MKKHLPWHHTRAGTLVLRLGSIELAVPVLALTAIALAVGTYLDSTRGAQVAREAVYGSWWFIATMGLVCISLIFAVFARFPWKRRHIGFMIVHASLVALIAGGFISLFGRVEGHLPLQEGSASDAMETQQEQIELVEFNAGQPRVLGIAPAPRGPITLSLGNSTIQIVERWENSREEQIVNDDAPMPFRGVQIIAEAGADPIWVGEEGKAGPAPIISGLLVRVLPDGVAWELPAKPAATGYKFAVNGHEFALGEVGQDACPGWRIAAVKRYTRAMVGNDGLIETDGGGENPAVDVTITDGKGSTERHTAFQNFTDMVMSRQVEGAAASGARLTPGSVSTGSETLVVFGPIAETRVGFINRAGEARILRSSGPFPRSLDLGTRQVTLAKQFAHAKGGWQTLKAESAKDNRPALVVRIDGAEPQIVAFKGVAPAGAARPNVALRYGPRMITLPFSIKLTDFRKTDYPGTDMAMAYESDVEVALPGSGITPFRIFMNHPYAHGPWKVYQSGFIGDNLSIFSITRDPGLPLTYVASACLCIGILITFFSRSLSWGHPGIPAAFAEREQPHVSPQTIAASRPAALGHPVSAGSV
jgi:hypothetical protein